MTQSVESAAAYDDVLLTILLGVEDLRDGRVALKGEALDRRCDAEQECK